MQPAAFQCIFGFLRPVPVAGEHLRAPDDHLSRLPVGDGRSLPRDQGHLDPGQCHPHGPGDAPARIRVGDVESRLGGAVALERHLSGHLLDGGGGSRWERRRARGNEAQSPQIAQPGAGVRQEAGVDGRDREEHGGPAPGDDVHQLLGIETGKDDRVAPPQQGGVDPAQSMLVGDGEAMHQHVLRRPPPRLHRTPNRRQQISMRQRNRLRPSGRPRGVLVDERCCRGRKLGQLRRGSLRERVEGGRARRDVVDRDDLRREAERGRDGLARAGHLSVGDHGSWPAVLVGLGQLVLLRRDVQEHRTRSQARDGVEAEHELGHVREDQQHVVARLDAEGDEAAGHTVDLLRQLGVGESPLAVDERDLRSEPICV